MKQKLRAGQLILLWSCAALLLMQLSATAQTLTHRYSFFNEADGATNAVDVVGTANGTFGGDAAISSGQLQLDGNAYVSLPSGIITNDLAVTVEAWGDYPAVASQSVWGNLFDFGAPSVVDLPGKADSHSISFCVDTGGTGLFDAAICDFDDANNQRQNCYTTVNPTQNGATGLYIAAVFNPPAGFIAIYTNGILSSKIAITETITPGVMDVSNWIGWDNWPDPQMVANLDEFRIWNGALNGLQIAASYQGGDSSIDTNAGAILSLQITAGPQVVEGGQEPATVLATASLITNTVDITTLAAYSSGNTNIITVDTLGGIHGVGIGSASVTASYGGQSNSVSVTVIEPVSVLTHRYSFNDPPGSTVVADSVGTLTGNLMGTAVETNGQVVLDGSVGCYVDLASNSFANDGIITGYQSATIDYWATIGNVGNWSYAWAFGDSLGYGLDYVHNVVRNFTTGHRIDHNSGGGQTIVDMEGDFANETVHCTTVMDPPTGHLIVYTNGVLSGYSFSDFEPLSTISTNFIYIGRSLWTGVGPNGTGDPYLVGSIDEIRVYNGALTPQQIALADVLGPNNTNLTVGALQSINVSIPTLTRGGSILGGLYANYAGLTNYNVLQDSLVPLMVYSSSDSNVVYQKADGRLHAVGLGSATVTANYGGFSGGQLVTVVDAPTLVHRYSFLDAPGSTDAADSVGGSNWDGVLPDGGTFTGSELDLSGGSDQYVQLPSYILSNYPAVTVDLWATFPTQMPVNCQLYAFGNTDAGGAGEYYIFCAPQGGRIAITGVDPGYDGEQGCGGAGDLSFQTNIHVTSVYDPPSGAEYLYTNGVLVSSNVGVTVPMSYVEGNDVLNYIGHSLYTGDPHEDLNLIEFRIYNGALSAADVAASQALGPHQLLTPGVTLAASVSSGNITISWPVSGTSGYGLYSSPTLGNGAVWTLVGTSPTVVGLNNQVSIPTGGSQAFFELKH